MTGERSGAPLTGRTRALGAAWRNRYPATSTRAPQRVENHRVAVNSG